MKKAILCKEKKEKEKIRERERENTKNTGVRGFFLIKMKRKRIVGEKGRERDRSKQNKEK